MSIGAQDLIVTVMALLSALTILRRVMGAFRPGKSNAACDNCASGAAACAKPPAETTPTDKPVPLTFHRRT
jgi:hypothetical protein